MVSVTLRLFDPSADFPMQAFQLIGARKQLCERPGCKLKSNKRNCVSENDRIFTGFIWL
jgi:hypothetical protein